MEYRIERLSAGNIALLKPLFLHVFKQTLSIDFLRRKYDTKVFGAEYVGYFALDGGDNVAAFYGVIPCHLNFYGEIILAAQSADTMTHPDHRSKGLFITLAEKTYALAREQGISLIFGFPNQNSMPGFQKLGWQFMKDQLQIFTLNTPAIPYARLINRISVLRNLYLSIVQSSVQSSVSIWKFSDEGRNGVHRDKHFLDYKTYNKTFISEIAGVKIWYRPDGNLKIGAVEGITELNTPRFLKLLKSFAVRLGCKEVVFMTSKKSSLYNALVSHIRALDAFPIGYLQLSPEASSFDTISFEYCDIDIF